MHWSQRRKLKRDYEAIISFKYRKRPERVTTRQKATVIRVIGKGERAWDEQNIGAGTAIELIDALTMAGYWIDDSPKYLTTAFEQQRSDKVKGPAVIVQLEP